MRRDEVEQVRARPERRVGVAVDADDLGRHALADLGLVARLGEDHQPAVAVEVDEPGRDDVTGGVDATRRPATSTSSPRAARSRSPTTPTAAREARRARCRRRACRPRSAGRSIGSRDPRRPVERAGPRTQAPRGPCPGAGGSEAADELGGVVASRSRRPGPAIRGSTAIRSASLPASSEPIDPSRPSARAPSSVPAAASRAGRAARRARRRARRARARALRVDARRASGRRSRAPGPAATSDPRPTGSPPPGSAPAASRPTRGTGSTPGSARGRAGLGDAGDLAVGEVDRVREDRPRRRARRPGRRRRGSRCASGNSRATSAISPWSSAGGSASRRRSAAPARPIRAACPACTRPRSGA